MRKTLLQLRLDRAASLGLNVPSSRVAKACGISRQYFWLIERGDAIPTLLVARKIAAFYAVTLDELADACEQTQQEGLPPETGMLSEVG